MEEEFEVRNGEMAGFDLGGYRQPNGTVRILGTEINDRIIPDWPEEIYLMGCTYTLEDIKEAQYADPENGRWENAVYC